MTSPHRGRLRWRPTLGIAVLAGLVGCGTVAEPAVAELDVLAYLRATPGGSWGADDLVGPMAREGVGPPQAMPDGTRFRWITAARARLVLDVATPAHAYDLVIDARPVGGAGPQQVGAMVNGVRLPQQPLGPDGLRWALPAGTLKAGPNALALDTSPTATDPDGRTLAFRLVRITLEPHFAADPDVLTLDAGEEVRVPFVGMPHAALEVAALDVTGGRLDVSVHLDGLRPDHAGGFADPGDHAGGVADPGLDAGLVRVASLGPGDAPTRLDLPIPPGEAGFLVMGLSGEGANATLRSPVLTADLPAPDGPVFERYVPGGPPPNIVVYVMDTTRGDRIGALGYRRPTTPSLAGLVRDGAHAYVAQSNSPWTRPSVGTILTGLEQGAHGVRFDDSALPDDIPTVTQRLHDAGYHTVGIAANPHVSRASGFARGFDVFVEKAGAGAFKPIRRERGGEERPDVHDIGKARLEYYLDEVVAAIEATPADQPLFLYLHSMAAHAPYQPPQAAQDALGLGVLPLLAGEPLATSPLQMGWINDVTHERIPLDPTVTAGLSALYDAEIRAEDDHVAALVAALQAAGRWDRTLLVVTADHGEQFGEHGGLNHTRHLYREYVEVPLVVRWPAGWRVPKNRAPALLDLAPTLLVAAGAEPIRGVQGRSLLSGAPPPRWRFAQTHAFEQYALWDDRYKLVVRKAAPAAVELYDLRADPGEQRELSAWHPARVELMRRAIEDHIAGNEAIRVAWTAEEAVFSEEQRRALEALGYVQGAP